MVKGFFVVNLVMVLTFNVLYGILSASIINKAADARFESI